MSRVNNLDVFNCTHELSFRINKNYDYVRGKSLNTFTFKDAITCYVSNVLLE